GPDGSYRFTQLPAGTYELLVVGYEVRRSGLQLTKGQRMTLDLQLPMPTAPRWEMHIERKFGLPILAGSLPRPGIEVTLKAPIGLTFKRISGSKPQYGPGGFEFWAPNRGIYTLSFLDQTFELTLEGGFTLVTFTETTSAPANKGIIRGQLRDSQGRPVAGRQVSLRDGGVARTTTTGADGSFQFDALAAGSYTLSVPDAGVTQTVQSDGRSTTTVALTLPAPPPQPPQSSSGWMMKVTRAPGLALIAGTLPEAGIQLVITPPVGQPIRVVSGSWPALGVGGFRVPALYRGIYTIQFLDQTFQLPMDGQYALLTFVRTASAEPATDAPSTEAMVRLVSSPLPRVVAEELLERLETDPQTHKRFRIEDG
ncbi:MAG: carboxypeptidase-like regulatory domain-containing protein, partial [Anaerolineae bacterium]|nr:carboxypeptidase-like regulatory domain-containing protein [Anaerolineae bacterium]